MPAFARDGSCPHPDVDGQGYLVDRVHGLDAGADDYMVKPFKWTNSWHVFVPLYGGLSWNVFRPSPLWTCPGYLDPPGNPQGRTIILTAKEYDLLELFLRHPRQVLTREVIFDRVWGYDFGGESNVLEVYIRYLRQKLESEGESRLIHTVRGVGYVMRETA